MLGPFPMVLPQKKKAVITASSSASTGRAIFTDGLAEFDEFYEKGYISKVVTTNLNYRPPELLNRPWYAEADMTKFLASIIDHLNHDVPTTKIQSPTNKINEMLGSLSSWS